MMKLKGRKIITFYNHHYHISIKYLFIRHIPDPTTKGSAHNNAKKKDKKEKTK